MPYRVVEAVSLLVFSEMLSGTVIIGALEFEFSSVSIRVVEAVALLVFLHFKIAGSVFVS